jgi:hypothetical protein
MGQVLVRNYSVFLNTSPFFINQLHVFRLGQQFRVKTGSPEAIFIFSRPIEG